MGSTFNESNSISLICSIIGFDSEKMEVLQSTSIDDFVLSHSSLVSSGSSSEPLEVTVVTSHLHPVSSALPSSPLSICTHVPLSVLSRCDHIVHIHTPPASEPWAKINAETALGIVLSYTCQWMGMKEVRRSEE
jgi:hypothetical protein